MATTAERRRPTAALPRELPGPESLPSFLDTFEQDYRAPREAPPPMPEVPALPPVEPPPKPLTLRRFLTGIPGAISGALMTPVEPRAPWEQPLPLPTLPSMAPLPPEEGEPSGVFGRALEHIATGQREALIGQRQVVEETPVLREMNRTFQNVLSGVFGTTAGVTQIPAMVDSLVRGDSPMALAEARRRAAEFAGEPIPPPMPTAERTIGDRSQQASEVLRSIARGLQPADPTFIDQVFQGLGSTGPLMLTGVGAMGLSRTLLGVSPRVAAWIGSITAALPEAMTEGTDTYQDLLDKGLQPAQAASTAKWVVAANAAFLPVSNKLGFFGEQGRWVRQMLMTALMEGGEEAVQGVIQRLAVEKGVSWEDVWPLAKEFLVGSTIGVLFKGAQLGYEHAMAKRPPGPLVTPPPVERPALPGEMPSPPSAERLALTGDVPTPPASRMTVEGEVVPTPIPLPPSAFEGVPHRPEAGRPPIESLLTPEERQRYQDFLTWMEQQSGAPLTAPTPEVSPAIAAIAPALEAFPQQAALPPAPEPLPTRPIPLGGETEPRVMGPSALEQPAPVPAPEPIAEALPPRPTPTPELVTPPTARPPGRLMEPQQLSDFRPGIDVVRRNPDGRTFVVDTMGERAPTEVQSDVMTPAHAQNLRALTPERQQRMATAIRTSPYLSEEGRTERLAVLESLQEPSFVIEEARPAPVPEALPPLPERQVPLIAPTYEEATRWEVSAPQQRQAIEEAFRREEIDADEAAQQLQTLEAQGQRYRDELPSATTTDEGLTRHRLTRALADVQLDRKMLEETGGYPEREPAPEPAVHTVEKAGVRGRWYVVAPTGVRISGQSYATYGDAIVAARALNEGQPLPETSAPAPATETPTPTTLPTPPPGEVSSPPVVQGTVRQNTVKGGIELTFSGKPPQSVLDQLHAGQWRYIRRGGRRFWLKRNPTAADAALANSLAQEAATPQLPAPPAETAPPVAVTEAPATTPPALKVGDRVTWEGQRGAQLSGTIRSMDPDGEISIDTDQIVSLGGRMPIRRVTVLTPTLSPEALSTLRKVEPEAAPLPAATPLPTPPADIALTQQAPAPAPGTAIQQLAGMSDEDIAAMLQQEAPSAAAPAPTPTAAEAPPRSQSLVALTSQRNDLRMQYQDMVRRERAADQGDRIEESDRLRDAIQRTRDHMRALDAQIEALETPAATPKPAVISPRASQMTVGEIDQQLIQLAQTITNATIDRDVALDNWNTASRRGDTPRIDQTLSQVATAGQYLANLREEEQRLEAQRAEAVQRETAPTATPEAQAPAPTTPPRVQPSEPSAEDMAFMRQPVEQLMTVADAQRAWDILIQYAQSNRDAVRRSPAPYAQKQRELQARIAELEAQAPPEAATPLPSAGVIPEAFAGIEDVFRGLNALLGGEQGGVKSFPGIQINRETYEQAKPYFIKAFQHFNNSGRSVNEFVRAAYAQWGERVRPLLQQFMQDLRDGVVSLEEAPVAETLPTPPPGTTTPAPVPALTPTEVGPGEGTAEAPKLSPTQVVATWVAQKLASEEAITSPELFAQADRAFGGTQAQGTYTPKDAYDAMELGINQSLRMNPLRGLDVAQEQVAELKAMLRLLPTQTKRTEEQVSFQQFSTPPPLAYTAAWVASMDNDDVVLEPSAGIGGLAIFARNAHAYTIVNEMNPRRAAILRRMGFDQVFEQNAEQLHNILPRAIQPSVVLMNPPFSSAAGRLGQQTQTSLVLRHLEQALERLAPNGRLVAIVGRGLAADRPTFRSWWDRIKAQYTVRANLGLSGKEYAKYGTTFDNQLVVIDKIGPTPSDAAILTDTVARIEDALPLLEPIRHARIPSSVRPAEQPTGEPTREETAPGPGGGPGPLPTPPPTTVPVGPGVGRGGTTEAAGGLPAGEPGRDVSVAPSPGPGVPPRATGGRGGSVGGGGPGVSPGGGPGPAPPGTAPTPTDRPRAVALDVQSQPIPEATADISTNIYEPYTPQKLQIAGAQPHPGKLVQSAAMASVEPPNPTYAPTLDPGLVTRGDLSLAQIEAVVYAGQAHQQILPDGERRGFFIGDGTGTGKGREISGILLDNLAQGRKKAVWFSTNGKLFKDAMRDFGETGGDTKQLFDLSKVNARGEIRRPDGVLFTTYATLRGGSKAGRDAAGNETPGQKRLDQIAKWLGDDFDGVIAFDESHLMANALPKRGTRGTQSASLAALAGLALQQRLPKARVLYVSATGATEVRNLAYATRLGLWGRGTSFANVNAFVNEIQSRGLATMELVARDLKARGLYISRNLSFDDVTYDTLEHPLTESQTNDYNTLARAWQIILGHVNDAVQLTASNHTGTSVSGQVRSNAMSAFWGAHQRFFNQIITSMQMPSVLERIHQNLADGDAVVLQLVNTLAATQDRKLASIVDEDEMTPEQLAMLDLTPRENLVQYLHNAFPVIQYETFMDNNGNEAFRPVVDAEGNFVLNQQAVDLRDQLVEEATMIRVPEGPIDIILNTFGTEQVAEVTGRQQRVVRRTNEAGVEVGDVQRRGESAAMADAAAFMDDKKPILIFSNAGGTGQSYHASLKAKNQRHRQHYLIQPGWQADRAVQGLGRTHRTNEASAPNYILVTTDIKGQKRFISSIARRLDQLGALTRGQRQTGGQGLFSARDNLESEYAEDAVLTFWRRLHADQIPGLDWHEVTGQMGLDRMIDPRTGALQLNDRSVKEFLNRMLSMEINLQNRVFDTFFSYIEEHVAAAMAAGTLDVGVETVRALRTDVMNEQTVYTDPESGAETRYVHLQLTQPRHINQFSDMHAVGQLGFFENARSGRLSAVYSAGTRTLPTGAMENRYFSYSPTSLLVLNDADLASLTPVDDATAAQRWQATVDATPPTMTEDMHVLTGAILPIWNRVPGYTRVVRLQSGDGRRFLGRMIEPTMLQATLRNLGATGTQLQVTPEDAVRRILDDGYIARLANGWTISRRRVAGEYRMEIRGSYADSISYDEAQILKREGAFTERIASDTRIFLPTGEPAASVFGAVTQYRPVVALDPPVRTTHEILDAQQGAAATPTAPGSTGAGIAPPTTVASTTPAPARAAPVLTPAPDLVALTDLERVSRPSVYVASPGGLIELRGRGTEVRIPGFESVDALVHPTLGTRGRYTVTEGTTGISIGHGANANAAVEAARAAIGRRGGLEAMQRMILEHVRRDGYTPRYQLRGPVAGYASGGSRGRLLDFGEPTPAPETPAPATTEGTPPAEAPAGTPPATSGRGRHLVIEPEGPQPESAPPTSSPPISSGRGRHLVLDPTPPNPAMPDPTPRDNGLASLAGDEEGSINVKALGSLLDSVTGPLLAFTRPKLWDLAQTAPDVHAAGLRHAAAMDHARVIARGHYEAMRRIVPGSKAKKDQYMRDFARYWNSEMGKGILRDPERAPRVRVEILGSDVEDAWLDDPIFQQINTYYRTRVQPQMEAMAPSAGIHTFLETPSGFYGKLHAMKEEDDPLDPASTRSRVDAPMPSSVAGYTTTGMIPRQLSRKRAKAALRASGAGVYSTDLQDMLEHMIIDRYTAAYKNQLIEVVQRYKEPVDRRTHRAPATVPEGKPFAGERVVLSDVGTARARAMARGLPIMPLEDIHLPKSVEDAWREVTVGSRLDQTTIPVLSSMGRAMTWAMLIGPADAVVHGMNLYMALQNAPGMGQSLGTFGRAVSWTPFKFFSILADAFNVTGPDMDRVMPILAKYAGLRTSMFGNEGDLERGLEWLGAKAGERPAQVGKAVGHGLSTVKRLVFDYPSYGRGIKGMESRARVVLYTTMERAHPDMSEAERVSRVNNFLGTYVPALQPEMVKVLRLFGLGNPFSVATATLTKTGVKGLVGRGPAGFSWEVAAQNWLAIPIGLYLLGILFDPQGDDRDPWDQPGWNPLALRVWRTATETMEIPIRYLFNSYARGLRATGIAAVAQAVAAGERDPSELTKVWLRNGLNVGLSLATGPFLNFAFGVGFGAAPHVTDRNRLLPLEPPTLQPSLTGRLWTGFKAAIPMAKQIDEVADRVMNPVDTPDQPAVADTMHEILSSLGDIASGLSGIQLATRPPEREMAASPGRIHAARIAEVGEGIARELRRVPPEQWGEQMRALIRERYRPEDYALAVRAIQRSFRGQMRSIGRYQPPMPPLPPLPPTGTSGAGSPP